jgi:hypothetical protein
MIFSMESEDGEAPVFFNARNHYSFFFLNFAVCVLMVCLIFSAMRRGRGFSVPPRASKGEQRTETLFHINTKL